MHEPTDHQPSRREALYTLATSGLALAVITAAGYLTPELLLAIAH